MLSSLKPANGKFVLGPPVETAPPIVVFTGPADHPDAVAQTASATPKKKKKTAGKHRRRRTSRPATSRQPKPAKTAKPKVVSAAQ